MSKAAKPEPGLLTKEIASILRAQVARKQILQKYAAAEAGISQARLSDLLNGHKQFDVEELDRICFAIGLDLADTLNEADEATSARYLDPDWNVKPLVTDD